MKHIVVDGAKLGKWTVLHRFDPAKRINAVVRCECGHQASIHRSAFTRAGRPSRSCHRCCKPNPGRKGTRAFEAWRAMHRRCYEASNAAFANYGGRGIEVCSRWSDFDRFLEDMGAPPAGLSLDRVDNDGNYGPDNCRWATPLQQVINRRKFRTRNSRPFTSRFRGVRKTKNGTWRAQISIDNRTVGLGCFESEEEAALAYNAAAACRGHQLNDMRQEEVSIGRRGQ